MLSIMLRWKTRPPTVFMPVSQLLRVALSSLTTLVVRVEQSVVRVCLCVRVITFRLNDLFDRKYFASRIIGEYGDRISVKYEDCTSSRLHKAKCYVKWSVRPRVCFYSFIHSNIEICMKIGIQTGSRLTDSAEAGWVFATWQSSLTTAVWPRRSWRNFVVDDDFFLSLFPAEKFISDGPTVAIICQI